MILYTEENIKVVFRKYYSFTLKQGWDADEGLDSLIVLDQSESLDNLLHKFNDDEVVFGKLYEFQFRTSYGEIVMSIVAEDISINGAAINLE